MCDYSSSLCSFLKTNGKEWNFLSAFAASDLGPGDLVGNKASVFCPYGIYMKETDKN